MPLVDARNHALDSPPKHARRFKQGKQNKRCRNDSIYGFQRPHNLACTCIKTSTNQPSSRAPSPPARRSPLTGALRTQPLPLMQRTESIGDGRTRDPRRDGQGQRAIRHSACSRKGLGARAVEVGVLRKAKEPHPRACRCGCASSSISMHSCNIQAPTAVLDPRCRTFLKHLLLRSGRPASSAASLEPSPHVSDQERRP